MSDCLIRTAKAREQLRAAYRHLTADDIAVMLRENERLMGELRAERERLLLKIAAREK